MNADEIVRALRICNNPKGHRCSECPVFSRYEYRVCKATVDRTAAALIKSQAAEIERFNATLAREGFNDIETMIAKYKTVILAANQLDIERDEEEEQLRAQLTVSQRRERAAIGGRAMSERQEKKRRHNRRLENIAEFEKWLRAEPPMIRYFKWRKWKRSRPTWKE